MAKNKELPHLIEESCPLFGQTLTAEKIDQVLFQFMTW